MWRVALFCLLVSTAHGASFRRSPVIQFGSGRIVGGALADEGEYPGQASLRYLGSHTCGASIISENYVLTAAHCVQVAFPGLMSVHVGSNDLREGGTTHDVKKITAHTGFSMEDFTSEDIAVIEVTPPFALTDLVQPVTLPVQDQETPGGSDATVIGWGRTSTNGPISQELLEVDQQIRAYQECFDVYTPDVDITEAQICADVPEGGKGICSGDSGGPLFVNGTIVGLVSWSANGCAAEGFPGVFTRVASYRAWITEHSGV